MSRSWLDVSWQALVTLVLAGLLVNSWVTLRHMRAQDEATRLEMFHSEVSLRHELRALSGALVDKGVLTAGEVIERRESDGK